MSMWLKVGVQVTDLDCFKKSCDDNGITYTEVRNQSFQGSKVHALLNDTQGLGSAYLIESEGAYKVVMDSDVNYSSIAARLGKNGGKITRDYTKGVVLKEINTAGQMVNSIEEEADGSILIKVAVM